MYLPPDMWGAMPEEEWTRLILQEYSNTHGTIANKDEAIATFLAIAQAMPLYGSTMFPGLIPKSNTLVSYDTYFNTLPSNSLLLFPWL